MGRLKRKSDILEHARRRLAGMKSIDEALDLGNGNSVTEIQTIIDSLNGSLAIYNQRLSSIDYLLNNVEKLEKELADLAQRTFAAVGAQFGFDSNEYEMAGGTRKSEIKKPTRSKPDVELNSESDESV